MDEVAFVVALAGLIIVPWSALVLFRGTILDLSRVRDNPWPLIWYFSLALCLVPLVIVSLLGIDNSPGLYLAQPGTEGVVVVAVLAALLIYIVTLSFSLRLFGLRKELLVIPLKDRKQVQSLATALCLLGLVVMAIFYLLGYQHAFFVALFGRETLVSVRLANTYSSAVPSQIASVISLIGYLLAVLGGYLRYQSLIKSFLYLTISLFLLSAHGDKAPFIWGVIVWVLAQAEFLPRRLFSLRSLISFCVIMSIGFLLIFFVLHLQIQEFSFEQFFWYILARLGIGQMSGVFETWGLFVANSMPTGDFYLHMIPGAKIFFDYIDYQKALMMITEGYEYTEMGVKNTFFVAEALAMGGLPLAFFSPIIVGVAAGAGLAILVSVMKKMLPMGMAAPVALMLYLKTHDINGGFSSFPMLKGIVLILVQVVVILIWCYLFSGFARMLKRSLVGSRTGGYDRG